MAKQLRDVGNPISDEKVKFTLSPFTIGV